jgi:hypothetical protein
MEVTRVMVGSYVKYEKGKGVVAEGRELR